jgi:PBSX family phage portal protein
MTELKTKTQVREFVNESTIHNLARVRALVVPVGKAEQRKQSAPGKSKELPEDYIEALVNAGHIVEPPFDLLQLAMLPENNTELGPCVSAMEINIEGFGHRLVPRIKVEEAGEELRREIERERLWLENFFLYASMDDSFVMFRRKLRIDLETTGNAEFEIIRNAAGEIQSFNHLPSYQMHLGREDRDPIKVEIPTYELVADGSVKIVKTSVWKRFRRYVQTRLTTRRNLSVTGSLETRWFKEFGDPRIYDNRTGEMVLDENKKQVEGRDLIPEDHRANEVMHLKLYSPRSPYGLPRTVGNFLSIFGDRAGEEINYTTIRNNNIPSLMLMVSNGQLTDPTIERLTEFMQSQIQGSDNFSKIVVVEAESPDMEGDQGSPGQVKIDAKPLTQAQHKDALFQEYSRNNRDKVRGAFRLSSLFTGKSEPFNRATAEVARRLADEQVFAPERDEFDQMINRRIFPVMGTRYHQFKSNSPNTTDNTELVRILAGAEKTGGMTPRIARIQLEDIMGIELPPFPEDFPQDVPFSLTMAEQVKNLGGDPTEPGQTVTAIKALEVIEKLTGPDIPLFDGGMNEEEVVERIMKVRDEMEERWRKEVEEA